MRSSLLILSVSIVSVFGLVSCSPESSGPSPAATAAPGSPLGSDDAPVTKSDDWKLQAPVIRDTQERKIGFAEASKVPHASNSAIVFENSRLEGVRFTIHTKCTSPSETTEDDFSIDAPPEIKLGSLWPKAWWLKADQDKLLNSYCTFDFTATNAVGSKHHFVLPLMRLNSLEAQEFNSFMNAGLEKEENLILKCPDFQMPTTRPASEDRAETIARLRTLSLRSGVVNKSHQECVVVSDFEQTGQLPSFNISQIFGLDFGQQPGRIQVVNNDTAFFSEAITSQPVFTFSITNPNPFAAAYRINTREMTFRFRPLYMSALPSTAKVGRLLIPAETRLIPLLSNTRGVSRDWQTVGGQILEVPAQTTIQVELHLASAPKCLRGLLPFEASETPGRDLGGVQFGYNKSIPIGQLNSWDPENPTPSGRVTELTEIQLPIWRDGVFHDGFLAAPAYRQEIDSQGAPPLPTMIDPAEGRDGDFCRN